jgi:hypothetical protein
MTLKAFHVVFVLAATLLSAGFGVWSFHTYLTAERETVHALLGALSLAFAVGLVVYGGWFLRKMKDVSYL